MNVVRKRQWVDKNEPPAPEAKAKLQGRKILLCLIRSQLLGIAKCVAV